MTVRVEIDGVGVVELDETFRSMSPSEQQAVVDQIARRHRGVPSGVSAEPAPIQGDYTLGDRLAYGTRRAIGSPLEGVGRRLDMPGLEATGEALGPTPGMEAARRAESARRDQLVDSGQRSGVREWFGDAGDTITESAPDMGGALAASGTGALIGAPFGPLGSAAGGLIGGLGYGIAQMYGEAYDVADAAGLDVNDPEVRRRIDAVALGGGALDAIVPGRVAGDVLGGALAGGVRRIATDTATEAATEVGQEALQATVLDPRSVEAPSLGAELAGYPEIIGENARDLSLAAVAGGAMGAGAGTVAAGPEIQRQRALARDYRAVRAANGQDPDATIGDIAAEAEAGSPEANEFLRALGVEPSSLNTDDRPDLRERVEERLGARRAAEEDRAGTVGGYDRPRARDLRYAEAERDALESGEMDPAAASTVGRERTLLPETIQVPPQTNERPSRAGIDAPDTGADPGLAAAVQSRREADADLQGRVERGRAVYEAGLSPRDAPPLQRTEDYSARRGEEIARGRETAEARRAAAERVANIEPERENTRRENMKAEAEGTFRLAERRRERFEDSASAPTTPPTSMDPRPGGRPQGRGDQEVPLVQMEDGGVQPVQVVGELEDGSLVVLPMRTMVTGRRENQQTSMVMDEEASPLRVQPGELFRGVWNPETRQAQEFSAAQAPRTSRRPGGEVGTELPSNPGVGRGGMASGDITTRQVRNPPPPPDPEVFDPENPQGPRPRDPEAPEDAEFYDQPGRGPDRQLGAPPPRQVQDQRPRPEPEAEPETPPAPPTDGQQGRQGEMFAPNEAGQREFTRRQADAPMRPRARQRPTPDAALRPPEPSQGRMDFDDGAFDPQGGRYSKEWLALRQWAEQQQRKGMKSDRRRQAVRNKENRNQPLIGYLKGRGGIDPNSPIGKALKARGFKPKDAPGLLARHSTATGGKDAIRSTSELTDLARDLYALGPDAAEQLGVEPPVDGDAQSSTLEVGLDELVSAIMDEAGPAATRQPFGPLNVQDAAEWQEMQGELEADRYADRLLDDEEFFEQQVSEMMQSELDRQAAEFASYQEEHGDADYYGDPFEDGTLEVASAIISSPEAFVEPETPPTPKAAKPKAAKPKAAKPKAAPSGPVSGTTYRDLKPLDEKTRRNYRPTSKTVGRWAAEGEAGFRSETYAGSGRMFLLNDQDPEFNRAAAEGGRTRTDDQLKKITAAAKDSTPITWLAEADEGGTRLVLGKTEQGDWVGVDRRVWGYVNKRRWVLEAGAPPSASKVALNAQRETRPGLLAIRSTDGAFMGAVAPLYPNTRPDTDTKKAKEYSAAMDKAEAAVAKRLDAIEAWAAGPAPGEPFGINDLPNEPDAPIEPLTPDQQARAADVFGSGDIPFSNPFFNPAAYAQLGRMMLAGYRAIRNKLSSLKSSASSLALQTKLGRSAQAFWRKASDRADTREAGTWGGQSMAAELASTVFNTMDGHVRGLYKGSGAKSKLFEQILDMTYRRPGEKTAEGVSGLTVENAQTRIINAFTAKLAKNLGGLRGDAEARVVAALRGQNGAYKALRSDAERRAYNGVKAQLRAMLTYMREAGVDVGEVKGDYFPREYDGDRVRENREQFVKNATALYRKTGLRSKEAKAKAEELADGLIVGGDILGRQSPEASAQSLFQDRKFSQLADQPVAKGGLAEFMVDDLRYSLLSYVSKAARRAEVARRFGDRMSKQEEMTRQMRSDGVPAEVIGALWEHVRVSAGLVPTTMSTPGRAISWMHAVTTASLLQLSTFTSLVETVAPAIRAGDGREAMGMLAEAGVDLVRKVFTLGAVEGRRAKLAASYELAQFVGAIAGDSALSMNIARFHGTDVVTRRQAQLLGGYFRAVQLQQFTDYTRAQSVAVGSRYVHRLGAAIRGESRLMPREEAVEVLSEFGIPEGDQEAFADWLKDMPAVPSPSELTGEQGQRMRDALFVFADQSIMRPTNATKPRWATSTALGRAVFALQSFGYAFTKNVLYRQLRNGKRSVKALGEGRVKDAMFYGGPILMTATLLPALQYAFGELRDEMEEAITGQEKRPLTNGAVIERAVSRAGLFGGLDPYIQAVSGTKYNSSVLQGALGPAAGLWGGLANNAATLGTANSPDTMSAERRAYGSGYDLFEGGVGLAAGTLAARHPYSGIAFAIILAARSGRYGVLDTVAPVERSKGDFEPITSFPETLGQNLGGQERRRTLLTPDQWDAIYDSKERVREFERGY